MKKEGGGFGIFSRQSSRKPDKLSWQFLLLHDNESDQLARWAIAALVMEGASLCPVREARP